MQCNSYSGVHSCLGKHGQANPLKEVEGYDFVFICVHGMEGFVHGLQSDQAGDKVVKVNGHVGFCVAQDDQLEQVVGQLETCRLKSHPHLIGAHGA